MGEHVITEPGLVYDLSNDAYHADTEWLSSSALKAALPEHYKQGGSQDALDFGTLVHSVVLEPDSLIDTHMVVDAHAIAGDNPKTGKPYDAPHMTAKYKAFIASALESGKAVVSAEDWDKAHAMRDALAQHDEAAELLFSRPGKSEVSAFWRAPDGSQHKARFDRLLDGEVVDLKTTTAKPGDHDLISAITSYGYDLSATHYLAVADGLDLNVERFTFVFVGKEPPHRVSVVDLDDEFLARGMDLRSQAIERLLNPAAPRYIGETGRRTLRCPIWARTATAVPDGIPADFTWSIHDYS